MVACCEGSEGGVLRRQRRWRVAQAAKVACYAGSEGGVLRRQRRWRVTQAAKVACYAGSEGLVSGRAMTHTRLTRLVIRGQFWRLMATH